MSKTPSMPSLLSVTIPAWNYAPDSIETVKDLFLICNIFNIVNNLTCCASFVKWPESLIRIIARNEISKSNSCERDETVVEWIQIVPVWLDAGEYGGRDQEQEHNDS